MIEQKFAGVQGASFVNPYHGDSNQIYTPQDYTDVAKNIAKLASTTYAQIQDNAFRQGQVDQLANALDTDRWLGKDSYMKGAIYAKAQVDMQHLSGEVIDIVNKGVKEGASSEEILQRIRDKQNSMIDTADQLRSTNPKAADNIINSLTAMQGSALKHKAELEVHLENKNRVAADTMVVNRMLSDFVINNGRDGMPMSNTTALIGSIMGTTQLLRENATIMGADEDSYVNAQLAGGIKALLVNADMTDANTMAFVNSLDKAMVTLHASGVLRADTIADIGLTVQQKVSQAHSVLEADAIRITNPSTPYTVGDESNLLQLAERMRVAGVNPKTIAMYMNQMDAKKAKYANAALSANNPVSHLPPKGSTEYPSAVKGIIDHATKTYELQDTVHTDLGRDCFIGDSFIAHNDLDQAATYYKRATKRVFAGIDSGGDSFDANMLAELTEFHRRVTLEASPEMRYVIKESLTPNQEMFVKNAVAGFLVEVDQISNSDMPPAEKKLALQKARSKLHEAWVNQNDGTTGVAPGMSVATSNNLKLSDTFNRFNVVGTNAGFGRLGIGDDTGKLLLSEMSHFIGDIENVAANSGIKLTDDADNVYDALEATGIYSHTAGGYAIVSPVGKAHFAPMLQDKQKFNATALDQTLEYFASRRQLTGGNDQTKYSTDDVVLMYNPRHGQWVKLTADGGIQNYEIIPKNVFRRIYSENYDKVLNKIDKTTRDIVISGVLTTAKNDEAPAGEVDAITSAAPTIASGESYTGKSFVEATAEKHEQFKQYWKDEISTLKFLTDLWDKHKPPATDENAWVKRAGRWLTDKDSLKDFNQWVMHADDPIKEKVQSMQKEFSNLLAEGKEWFKTEIVDKGIDLADDAKQKFTDDAELNSVLAMHLKARMYSALYSSDGTYFSKLTDQERSIVEKLMSNDPISPMWRDKANVLVAQAMVSSMTFMEKLVQTVYGTSTKPVITSDGLGGNNTFWITNTIGNSCFGYDLGVKVMTNLAQQEGMILQARATDPRYTKDKVIGIGYKEGYPAWDKAFRDAAGNAMELSRVTNLFAVWYFSNIPERLKEHTGIDWETARGNADMQNTLVSLSDFLWHSGRNNRGYYEAMEYVKKNDMEGALNRIKQTAAYKQSGSKRKQLLVDGLYSFNTYWNGTQR